MKPPKCNFCKSDKYGGHEHNCFILTGKNPNAVADMPQADIDRFWSHVDKSGDCWNWKAHKDKRGYGNFSFKNKPHRAARVSWFLTNGEAGKLLVCHKCDNPSCVNPAHLFLGTSKENTTDGIVKGRINVVGSKNPFAKLTEQQVREIKDKFVPHHYKVKTLAKEYGVGIGTIESIIYGQRWAHIAATSLGALGGKSKTAAKVNASRKNGKKGGRPKNKRKGRTSVSAQITQTKEHTTE